MTHRRCLSLMALVLTACSGKASVASVPAVTPTVTPANVSPPAPLPTAAATPAPPPTPTPALPPAVRLPEEDLLHAVPTTVRVSSVYRDRTADIRKLADGNMNTAWNSRTGDVAGAYMEVQLPADAHVTSIAMTVGFTREGGDTDLFLGNRRIARVRLSRNGVALREVDLDISSRELQSMPVDGEGGTYRIEVLVTARGLRPDWDEVCVSELRVMGSPAAPSTGEVTPTFMLQGAPTPMAYEEEWNLTEEEELREVAIGEAIDAFSQTWLSGNYDRSDEDYARAEQAVQVSTPPSQCHWAETRLAVREARLAYRMDQWNDQSMHFVAVRVAELGYDTPETLAATRAQNRVEAFRDRLDTMEAPEALRATLPEGQTFAEPWRHIQALARDIVAHCPLE